MLEQKINSLEETVAHQDQQIYTLSKTVAKQWEIIDSLTKNMEIIKEQIKEIENNSSNSSISKNGSLSTIDKPPHY